MIFKSGLDILDKELDIEKILKKLRNLKIFCQSLGYEERKKFII
jgi:hypothetical protein